MDTLATHIYFRAVLHCLVLRRLSEKPYRWRKLVLAGNDVRLAGRLGVVRWGRGRPERLLQNQGLDRREVADSMSGVLAVAPNAFIMRTIASLWRAFVVLRWPSCKRAWTY